MATLGERLGLLRSELNLSQQYVADFIHVSREVLSNYERDRNEPPDATKKILASFYNVTLDFLCGYSDYRTNLNIIEINNSNYVDIPIMEVAPDNKITSGSFVTISADKIKNGTYFFIAAPEDFAEARIQKSDMLFTRKELILDEEVLALVSISEELHIKKVFPINSEYILFNSSYTPNFIRLPKDQVEILGQIIEVTFKI